MPFLPHNGVCVGEEGGGRMISLSYLVPFTMEPETRNYICSVFSLSLAISLSFSLPGPYRK